MRGRGWGWDDFEERVLNDPSRLIRHESTKEYDFVLPEES